MSPELISSVGMNQIKKEWKYLVKMGFDGICTNHPMELKKWLELEGQVNWT